MNIITMQGHSIQIFKYFSQVVEIVLYDPALKDFSMICEFLLENGTNPLAETRVLCTLQVKTGTKMSWESYSSLEQMLPV